MKKICFVLLLAATGLTAQEKVNFEAHIKNANSDTLTLKGQGGFKKVMVGKKGDFKDSFEVTKGFYQLGDGTEVTQVFLAPGFDVKLDMDAKQFDESIKYSGKGSKENNTMAYIALEQEKMEEVLESGDETRVNAFVDAMLKGVNERTADKEVDEMFRNLVNGSFGNLKAQVKQMLDAKAATAKLTGSAAPAFDYENHKGGKTKLEDLKGKYVYIDVWATWCGPCRAEIPHLKKTEAKYHGKNIEFVSISVDTPKDYEKWKKFVVDNKLGGTQLIADNNWNSAFIQAFGINSIPRFILIGPDGKVVNADAPRPSMPALATTLDGLLK